VIKQTDRSTPPLFQEYVDGSIIGSAVIFLTKENNVGDLEIYFKITLEDVIIREFQQTISPVSDQVYAHVESLRMIFSMLTMEDLTTGNTAIWTF
jgi:type VI secretion system Hcp family effector